MSAIDKCINNGFWMNPTDPMEDVKKEARAELDKLRKDSERLDAIKPPLHFAPEPDTAIELKIGNRWWRILHTHYRAVTGWYAFEIKHRGAQWRGKNHIGPLKTFQAIIDAAMEEK